MNPTPSQPERPEPPEGYELNDSVDHLPEGSMIRSRFYPTDNWGIATYAGMDIKPEYHLHWWVAIPATRTPAPDGSKQAESDHASPPDKCPVCGSPEVEANTPRTAYACGSSDCDQRPGTFIQQCSAPEAVAGEDKCPHCARGHKLDNSSGDRPETFGTWYCSHCEAEGGPDGAPTPPADKDADKLAVDSMWDEISKLASDNGWTNEPEEPGPIDYLRETINQDTADLLAANQRIEALEGALRWIFKRTESGLLDIPIREKARAALAHAAEVGKGQKP